MKKLFIGALLLSIANTSKAQSSLRDIATKLGSTITKSSGNNNSSNTTDINLLGNSEIGNGLKEALKVGSQIATNELSATNGFFGNQLIKIMMPPEVRSIESKMRQFGMGKLVDNAILAMNRAAEDASKQALPILTNAITSMSIADGLAILKGSDNAATEYLKGKTTPQITEAFRPIISNAMNKNRVDQLWGQVFKAYNSLPIIKNKVNTDLTGYVTEKTLSGLFTSIATQEKKIRLDPFGTGSDIISRVFGSK